MEKWRKVHKNAVHKPISPFRCPFIGNSKYLSRLIITFYKKSTINITDLINKYDWVWASKISELATGLVKVKLVLERQIKEKIRLSRS